jgi:erythromycin esterase
MKIIKTLFSCSIIVLISNSVIAQNSYPKKYNLDLDNFNAEKIMSEGWIKGGTLENLNENVTVEKIENENYIIKITSTDKNKFGCIGYNIPPNYVGDTIKLTGRIKYKNVGSYVGLWMRIAGVNGVLAFENMQKYKIKGTNDWKEFSIKLPYKTGVENITIGGILSGKGTAWFDDFVVTIDDKDVQTMEETPKIYLKNYNNPELNSAIHNSSTPIDLSTNENLSSSLDALIAKLGSQKIVAIGESTHGTAEFYRLREIITKRLIEEKGYNMVVLENPYDDIELLNQDLMKSPLDSLIKKHLFSIYQTKEMESFLKWYKDNRVKYNIKFKGCDDSPWVFYELLSENLNVDKDEKLSKLLQKLRLNIEKKSKSNFKKELKISLTIYETILEIENQLKSSNKLTPFLSEILFNGKTTYIYYLNREKGDRYQSRDEIMASRISYLSKNGNNKIIVWAHDAHISNKIIADNEIGVMGENLKKEFNNDYYSIGLTTLKGSYSFINEKFIFGDHMYADKLNKTEILPNETNFWENSLALNDKAFYLDIPRLTKELKTEQITGQMKLIGYGKETKNEIYLLPLLKLFDSLIFIENTNATTPLFE